jgi:hypothetical protein
MIITLRRVQTSLNHALSSFEIEPTTITFPLLLFQISDDHKKIGVIRSSLSRAKALSERWPLRFGVQVVVKRWRCCDEQKGGDRSVKMIIPEATAAKSEVAPLFRSQTTAPTRLPPPNRSWSSLGRAPPFLNPTGFEQDVGATSSYGSQPPDLTL